MQSTGGSKSTYLARMCINLVADHMESQEPLTILFVGMAYSLELKLNVKIPIPDHYNVPLSDVLQLQAALRQLSEVINSIVSKQYDKRS